MKYTEKKFCTKLVSFTRSHFMKTSPVGAEIFYVDRQIDTTKLASHNFANTTVK